MSGEYEFDGCCDSPCPHQWQPTSELDAKVESNYDAFAVQRNKAGQWFRLPLPPLPEGEQQ